MFLQWCRDELVLSFIFVQRLVSWDRTRLRKGTTAETQTLVAIGPGQICVSKKNRRQFSNKDFPRGQVNGYADNLDFEKKRGQGKK